MMITIGALHVVITWLINYHRCDACIYWDETSSSVQTIRLLIPLCCAASVFPIPSPTCHRRRESGSLKPTSSCVPAGGRGRIRFLGSVVVIARWMSSSLYASVHESLLTVCFVYFCALSSAKNLTVRMPTLSLLFILVFLRLLALESLSLPRIVVLVLNHTPMIHVVFLFLNIGINLCVTKLLLFPTYMTSSQRPVYFLLQI